jgi:hypothetical protein
MNGHDESSLGSDARVGREHVQTGEKMVLRHIAGRRLHQLRAVELAAGVAGHEGIARPVLRPENGSSIHWFIKIQSAGRLVLRPVVENARLVDHLRQMLGMSWRKAIMPTRLDVQQLIERVSIGQPGRSFLVGREQVSQSIERQPHWEANAGGQHFPPREIGRDP